MGSSRLLLPVMTAAALAGWPQHSPSTEARASTDRLEHFVLEGPALRGEESGIERPDGARRRVVVRGLAQWRRRDTEGGRQLELEVHYPREGLRLMGVECLTEQGSRLVWREVSRSAGRTLMAEWDDDGGGLRVLEWGIDGVLRERTDARAGAVMPLYLLELLRTGRATGGQFLVFDPLGRGLEPITAHTAYLARGDGSGFARRVELRREDGTLAGRYTFAGDSLEAFQWQESDVHARRIDARAYAELRIRLGVDPLPETVKEL